MTTEPFIWGGWNDFWLVECGWQEYYPDVGEQAGAAIACGLCSTRVEWTWPPDSSVWAWGDTIPVARYDTLFWCDEEPEVLGPDTCLFYSGDYEPDIFTLRAEIFGPYPPGTENDPIWYFGGDSLRFWSVKVEVDEELSHRILDVPVAEGDSATTPVRTVFRVLPDSASSRVSFLYSPMAQEPDAVKFFHYVTRESGSGAVDTLKARREFRVDTLQTVGVPGEGKWQYILHWVQKADTGPSAGQWFVIDTGINDRPYESHVMMRLGSETREERELEDLHNAKPFGLDLVIKLGAMRGGREGDLPEEEEQGEGKGLHLQLNDSHDAEQPVPDLDFEGSTETEDPQLVPVGLSLPDEAPDGAMVRLSIAGTDASGVGVKVWTDPLKGMGNLLMGGPGARFPEYTATWQLADVELREMVRKGLWLEATGMEPGMRMSLVFIDPAGSWIEDVVEGHTVRLKVVEIDARAPEYTEVRYDLTPTDAILESALFYFPGAEPYDIGNASGTFSCFYDQGELLPGTHNIVVEGAVHGTPFRCGYVAEREEVEAPEGDLWKAVLFIADVGLEEWGLPYAVHGRHESKEWFDIVDYLEFRPSDASSGPPVSLVPGSKNLVIGESTVRLDVGEAFNIWSEGLGPSWWLESHLYFQPQEESSYMETMEDISDPSWETGHRQIKHSMVSDALCSGSVGVAQCNQLSVSLWYDTGGPPAEVIIETASGTVIWVPLVR